MEKIYLDYASTTPIDQSVFTAMKPYFSEKFGNPSSLHFFGQQTMAAVDESREKIAKAIAAGFREIIFTGSATEANNLALRGIVEKYRIQNLESNKNRNAQNPSLNHNDYVLIPRIIVSSIEHGSILETCRDLKKQGIEIIYLPVNYEGLIDLKKMEKALNERTILVSIMYANNEIGTIQPISNIAEIIRKFKIKNEKSKKKNSELAATLPLFHTDAVQAFQYLDCNVNNLGIDLMTLSAHKIYGPKGIGCLYIKSINSKSYILNSVVTGGGQEFNLRSGTENVAGIVGFAKAIELAFNSRKLQIKKIANLRDYFWEKIKIIYPKARINGILNKKSRIQKLPNILNIYFPGHLAEDILIKFDLAGIAVSSGSACSSRASKLSHVLMACGLPLNRVKSSLRISFGKFTTRTEIDKAIKKIKKIIRN